jgi:hypothetical protein
LAAAHGIIEAASAYVVDTTYARFTFHLLVL